MPVPLPLTRIALLFAAVGVFSACAADVAPPVAVDLERRQNATRSHATGKHENVLGDARFVELAQRVPGFGGLFFDSVGNPVVYLVDPSQRENAQRELLPFLETPRPVGRDGVPSGLRIVVRRGNFDFAQLNRWHKRANEVLGAVGEVVFSDADESQNRIVIGVSSEAARADVIARMVAAGVPADAFLTQVTKPFSATARLSDEFTEPPAGVIIITEEAPTGLRDVCTLGPNLKHTDTGQRFFLVNAHCTGTTGVNNSTKVYQYLRTPRLIGVEVLDYAYNRHDIQFLQVGQSCPWAARCRFADVALVEYVPEVHGDFGKIARPYADGSVADHQLINDHSPRFPITSTADRAVVNQRVNKVGVASGWTSGYVARTCTDLYTGYNAATGITTMILCQDVAAAYATGGDSGAPVFAELAAGGVELVGILHSSNGAEFMYSPWANILKELKGPYVPFGAADSTVPPGTGTCGADALRGCVN